MLTLMFTFGAKMPLTKWGIYNLFSYLKQRNIIRLRLAAVHGDVDLSFILICNMWRDPSLSQFSRETIALCLNSQERHLLPHDGAIHVLLKRPLVQLLIVCRILYITSLLVMWQATGVAMWLYISLYMCLLRIVIIYYNQLRTCMTQIG